MSAKTPDQIKKAVKELVAEIGTNMYIVNQQRYIHEVRPELETDKSKEDTMKAAASMMVDMEYLSALLWVIDPENKTKYPDKMLTIPEAKEIMKRLGIE